MLPRSIRQFYPVCTQVYLIIDGTFVVEVDGREVPRSDPEPSSVSAPPSAYVPSLIGVDRVVEGNSKLATSSSLAEIGGPGIAGGLVQLIGAPFAILVDAISFGVSAISLGLIRRPEPARPARTSPTPIRHEILEACDWLAGTRCSSR